MSKANEYAGKPCPIHNCAVQALALPGELAAHLVEKHEWDGENAMIRAREYLAGPGTNGAVISMPECTYCHRRGRTHTPSCRKGKGPRRGKKKSLSPQKRRRIAAAKRVVAPATTLDQAIADARAKVAAWSALAEKMEAVKADLAGMLA